MKKTLLALGLAGALAGVAPPAAADSGPPPLPALSAEQSANLNDEMTRYRAQIDERVARGELRPDEAQRLVEWRRWQLARQIAGLVPPEPPRVIVQPEYAYRPYAYDPYYGPYYGPRYYAPRVSVCAGGWGRHSFGSLCF
jgi:hypothetical protein